MPERRGRSNRSRMRTSSVEGKSHPKPNREQFLADERQTAEALGGSASWHLGRVASRERTGRERLGEETRARTSRSWRHWNCDGPRAGLDAGEQKVAEGQRPRIGRGAATEREQDDRRTRETRNQLDGPVEEPPAERREGAKNAASKRGMAAPTGRVKEVRIILHPAGAYELVRWPAAPRDSHRPGRCGARRPAPRRAALKRDAHRRAARGWPARSSLDILLRVGAPPGTHRRSSGQRSSRPWT